VPPGISSNTKARKSRGKEARLYRETGPGQQPCLRRGTAWRSIERICGLRKCGSGGERTVGQAALQ